jgi:hypothetical protein
MGPICPKLGIKNLEAPHIHVPKGVSFFCRSLKLGIEILEFGTIGGILQAKAEIAAND